MMKSLIASFTLTLLTVSATAQEQTPVATEAPVTTGEIVTAKVNGMVCDFCARAVSKVFGKRDEVAGVDVDLDGGQIIVTMNKGQTLDDATVKDLIRKSGYSFVSMERTTGA